LASLLASCASTSIWGNSARLPEFASLSGLADMITLWVLPMLADITTTPVYIYITAMIAILW